MVSKLFLAVLFTDVFSHTWSADVIQGTYHAWWAIVPLPRDEVQKMLPNSALQLQAVRLAGLGPNTHPIMFEIGREYNCGPTEPTFLQKNFNEFKFEIPFIRLNTSKQALMNYKQIIYQDSLLESTSSRLLYKLNASDAVMQMSQIDYDIRFANVKFHANITPAGNWGGKDDYPQFEPYRSISSLSWFGDVTAETCAEHHYNYDSMTLRPVSIQMTFDPNILNGRFTPAPLRLQPMTSTPLGAVEVNVTFTMTLPHSCN